MKLSDVFGFIEDTDSYTIKHEGHTIKLIDDYGMSCGSNTEWFLIGHEFGATHLVHAKGFDSAYDAWLDEQPTIPRNKLIEAYGPEGTPNGSFLDMAHDEARGETVPFPSAEWRVKIEAIHKRAEEMLKACECPELIEGYAYQSNATGTGIVSVGDYVWCREIDLDEIEITRKESDLEQ